MESVEREYRKDVDNIVNDLPRENMFEICLKNIIPLPQHYFAEADSKKQICLGKSLGTYRR